MKKKVILILVVIVVLAGVAAWRLNLPARLGWSEQQEAGLTLYGNVDIREVNLGFRVGGRIADMMVDEGDSVKPGQLLARLDAQPYTDAVQAAQAKVDSLAAVLAKLKAGPRPAEIDRSRALLAASEAELENAQLSYKRAKELRPRDLVSQADYDRAKTTRDMAEAQMASARESLRLLEEGTRSEDLDAAKANLASAQASLAAAETSLHDTELHAAEGGVILSRVREPGAIVSPADVIYVQSLTKPVWVRAYVPEPDLGRIHPGMKVEIVTDSNSHHPYQGQIGYISPVAEFTPKSVETPELRTDLVYRLRIVVEAADDGLRQGMPVTVRVPVDDNGSGNP